MLSTRESLVQILNPEHYGFGSGWKKDRQLLLQSFMGAHNFPLFQGPVFLPIDTATEEKLTVGQVLITRTVFGHSEGQDCKYQPDI